MVVEEKSHVAAMAVALKHGYDRRSNGGLLEVCGCSVPLHVGVRMSCVYKMCPQIAGLTNAVHTEED